MELPLKVMIHNEILGMKGTQGTLLDVAPAGFFEVNCSFGDRIHRVLLPIRSTVLIAQEPEVIPDAKVEIER